MKLTASQAAKQTGKSIPTITRAIKSGKISAERTNSGGYLIEPSELFRVFLPVTVKDNVIGRKLDDETPNELGVLQDKVKLLEEALVDAKNERDEWRDQAKRLTLALPAPENKSTTEPQKWWKFWLR